MLSWGDCDRVFDLCSLGSGRVWVWRFERADTCLAAAFQTSSVFTKLKLNPQRTPRPHQVRYRSRIRQPSRRFEASRLDLLFPSYRAALIVPQFTPSAAGRVGSDTAESGRPVPGSGFFLGAPPCVRLLRGIPLPWPTVRQFPPGARD